MVQGYKETEIKIMDIIEIIIEKSPSREIIGKEQFIEILLKSLDFHNGNEHIQNPLNLDPEFHYFVEREEPLTGSEVVYGDYLVYDSVGHDGAEYIWKFASLEEAEKFMLGGAGISNPFTTEMFLIEFGIYKEFEYDVVKNCLVWLS